MPARLVVLAVFVLAAAAAGDALKGVGAGEPLERGDRRSPGGPASPVLYEGKRPEFQADGSFLSKRVLRAGEEYLSAEAVERAFPGTGDWPLDISKVAVAPDGTLVLAVYQFPAGRPAVGALELWRGRRLVAAFRVPPGYFGGGLAFNRDGSLIATFSHDGALRAIYDRRGRRVGGLSKSFLEAD